MHTAQTSHLDIQKYPGGGWDKLSSERTNRFAQGLCPSSKSVGQVLLHYVLVQFQIKELNQLYSFQFLLSITCLRRILLSRGRAQRISGQR